MLRLLLAGVVGFLAHHLLFIHGEWHLLAPTVVTSHILLICLFVTFEILAGNTWNDVTTTVIATLTCYLSSLYTSIVIYRIYFHRLRNFPGPRLAGISKLWHVWQCRDSRNHLVLENLRHKYGAFVRTGAEPDVINAVAAPANTHPRPQ